MTFLISPFSGKIPTRFNVAVMLFMATFTAYMLRTNISIAMIPMIKENTTSAQMDYGPRYSWSKKDQSWVLGGYFYGYLTTSLFGGALAERFGGRQVVGVAMLFSGLFTGIEPFLASDNFLPTFIIRFIIGVFGGLIYPGLHCLVALWSPPDEKGKFISALLGGLLGTVCTWSSLGVIIENFGWQYGFYVPSVIALFLTLLWYILVADSPEVHRSISKEEREFIQNSLGSNVTTEKRFLPLGQVFTSIPFIALLILHYGSLWGLFFLMNAAPMFMVQALNFNLSKAGFLAALPPLARLIAGFIFGSIGDLIRRKKVFSVTTIRKSFCLFSHIIPGLFLLSITFLAYNKYYVVAVITLSLGFNGAATMTNLQNSQDLAPNFAGSIYGIINFVGTSSGFITPLIVAHFTEHGNSIYEWQHVFWVGAAVYIIPAFLFFIMGDGNIQPWNESKKKENSVDTKL